MNYQEFFVEAARLEVKITTSHGAERSVDLGLANEALFQIPLLAMVILTLAKGRSKPKITEIGLLVGECLERSVAGFKCSSQSIGWSANLRMRTIKALTFVERRGLLTVDPRKNTIAATELGRQMLQRINEVETPLAIALSVIERSFENIRAERGILEEVE
jgi:hypothetical protein